MFRSKLKYKYSNKCEDVTDSFGIIAWKIDIK